MPLKERKCIMIKIKSLLIIFLSLSSGVCRMLASLLYGLEFHMDASEDSKFLQEMLMGNTLHLLIKVRLYFSSHPAHFSDCLPVLRLELGEMI